MKDDRKIAVLIDRLNVGGVEKIAIEEVKALRELGKNAYLVVLRRKGVVDNAFEDLRKGLPTVFLDDRLPFFLKFSFKFPVSNFFSLFHISYPFLIPFVLKKNEFDYFIVHGTCTAFTAIGIKKFKKLGYSVFIWDPISYILSRVYSKNFPKFFLKNLILIAGFLDKIIINNADVILVGGDAHDKFIRSKNSKVKIETIPPSVHSLKRILNHKENYVLMVTAWKHGKNPEYVFELLKKMPKLKIKMVGKWLDGFYKKEFIAKVRENKFINNIEVVGEVNEEELSKYYSRALILLQTNDDRGFGMPALEAAGHGTTFIIPKGQGVCNLFIDKADGFYTKEKDTNSIINYLRLLINNKELAAKMGKSAWQKVSAEYSWKNHAQALLKVASKYIRT